MLTFAQYEELDELLLRAAAVVGLYGAKSPAFVEEALEYLDGLVETLERNRLSTSARVAGMRATAASDAPRDGSRRSPASRRAQRAGSLAAAIRDAVEIVYESTAADRRRFAEADDAARRLVTLAAFKGLYEPGPTLSLVDAGNLYRAAKSDPDLAGGALALESLVGVRDAILVLDRRALDPLDGLGAAGGA